MAEFLQGVVAHVVMACFGGAAGYVVHKNLLWLTKLFDPVARRQAGLINGTWTATEKFSDDGTQARYKLEFTCRGAQVTGTQTYASGRADKNQTFDLHGSFENLVLNLTWTKKDSIETGTATLRYVSDKKLEGHGLYVLDQKVYTSIFTATKD